MEGAAYSPITVLLAREHMYLFCNLVSRKEKVAFNREKKVKDFKKRCKGTARGWTCRCARAKNSNRAFLTELHTRCPACDAAKNTRPGCLYHVFGTSMQVFFCGRLLFCNASVRCIHWRPDFPGLRQAEACFLMEHEVCSYGAKGMCLEAQWFQDWRSRNFLEIFCCWYVRVAR